MCVTCGLKRRRFECRERFEQPLLRFRKPDTMPAHRSRQLESDVAARAPKHDGEFGLVAEPAQPEKPRKTGLVSAVGRGAQQQDTPGATGELGTRLVPLGVAACDVCFVDYQQV